MAFSQPEERSDYAFVEEIYQLNPLSIISRRELAALILNDTAQIEREYILCRPEMGPSVRQFIKDYTESGGDGEAVARNLLYPRYAKRNWVSWFENRGALGVEPTGLGGQFSEAVERIQNKDVRIESYLFGQNIQIVHTIFWIKNRDV